MRRVLWFLPAMILLCVPIHAQTPEGQVPPQTAPTVQAPVLAPGPAEWEIAGGYSFLRTNIRGAGQSVNLNGGTVSVTENLNNWFGGRFTFNAWGGTESPFNVTAQSYTYGPVFSLRRASRATLFADVEFGAIHGSQGFLGLSTSSNAFAMTSGGGVDFKVSRMAAIRLQGDYLLTRFFSARQNHVFASASLVIYLGRRKKGFSQ
jgi:hypothetical protein